MNEEASQDTMNEKIIAAALLEFSGIGLAV